MDNVEFQVRHGHAFGLAVQAPVAYADCTDDELDRLTKEIVAYAVQHQIPRKWEFAYDRPMPQGGFFWHMIPAQVAGEREREYLVRVVQQTTYSCVVTADDPASAISVVAERVRAGVAEELGTERRTIVDCEAYIIGGPGAGAVST